MKPTKEHDYAVTTSCICCKEKHTIYVNSEDWQLFMQPSRPCIQEIFPYLTPDETEILISGICTKCWEAMFSENNFPDEDDEVKHFLDDIEKMVDFAILTKEEFLASYSYLTEEEYDATREAYEKSIQDSDKH